MSEYKKQREFIHDISNQLAVIDGALRRVQKLKSKKDDSIASGEADEFIDTSLDYVKGCISKLKEFRSYIHELENQK